MAHPGTPGQWQKIMWNMNISAGSSSIFKNSILLLQCSTNYKLTEILDKIVTQKMGIKWPAKPTSSASRSFNVAIEHRANFTKIKKWHFHNVNSSLDPKKTQHQWLFESHCHYNMLKNDERFLAFFTTNWPVIFIDSNPCCATLICSWLSKSSKMMNGLPYVRLDYRQDLSSNPLNRHA